MNRAPVISWLMSARVLEDSQLNGIVNMLCTITTSEPANADSTRLM